MLNLFPPEVKKAQTREYLLRLCVVSLWFLGALASIALLLLVPPYVSLQIKKGVLLDESESIKAAISSQGTDVVDAFLKETNTRAALLATYQPRRNVHKLVEALVAQTPAGVHLTGITYTTKNGPEKLIIRGVADERESAVVFVRQLETEALFSNVDLPISNLARNEDIVFTMTLEVAQAKANDV